MKRAIIGAAVLLALVPSARATECKVEDFRHYISGGDAIVFQGVSNCESSSVTVRAYDGEGEERKFLGATAMPFFGYVFGGMINRVPDLRRLEEQGRLRFRFAFRKRG